MRILLDTHVLIWAISEPSRLPGGTMLDLSNRDNEVMFSAVNVWEVAIKFALRRPDFPLKPEELISYAAEMEFVELPVFASAAALVGTLPLYHHDPFDRLLVAQAMSAGAVLLTGDRLLEAYGPSVQMLT